ncbi:hypothetical protein BX600DRAFT_89594 [Xylariales sp. PMI_506]|nr:hypothetical protein BX600DRAFT_89594 [Xylariales sp. PMI_506]
MPGLSESRWASPTLRTWPHKVPSSLPQRAPPSEPQPQRLAPPPSTTSAATTRSPSPAAVSVSSVASSTSAPASLHKSYTNAQRELSRYLKLVARLKWKLPFLAEGYRIATDRAGRPREDIAAHEIHFKIDFYEYYMHIERALVHLMGVYGIKVTGLMDSVHSGGSNPNNNNNGNGRGGSGGGGSNHQHRYHANVLAALDRADNPLHEVLGKGEVRRQLARAKELRNRWKNGGESDGDDADGLQQQQQQQRQDADGNAPPPRRKYTPAPLEAYNLEMILASIFHGFDQSHLIAETYLQQLGAGLSAGAATVAVAPGGSTAAQHDLEMDWDVEDDDWGFMVDAMDWEAV